MNADEKRGYGKGYSAGTRRAVREINHDQVRAEQEAFEREVFVAVLPALLVDKTWKTGDKRWSTMQEYTSGAREFASEAGKRFNFLPPLEWKGGDDS